MSCERHYEIVEKLDDHERRIVQLEINDARTGEKIQSLIEKIESLTTWIKALVMLGATSLVGFFFWYIQSIGGK
jgi:hypothetical protein